MTGMMIAGATTGSTATTAVTIAIAIIDSA
jgi:hypothetical protein